MFPALSPAGTRCPNPAAADDGDEFTFCSTCAFSQACLSEGYAKQDLAALHVLVDHIGPYHAGQYIFREGDTFNAISAVRAGAVKTFIVDPAGNEQVLGFYLPGEVIGLNAIHAARFPCNAVALDTVTLCRFSFPQLATLAAKMPGLQQHLFKLLSMDIGKSSMLAVDSLAEVRMAAFLVVLSRRYLARGFSAHRFNLAMTRADIANYLRIAPETVSRIIRKFSNDGLIEVHQRDVHLMDIARLEALARAILRD
ncbi:transcriptional regulator [Lysobacter pythonis]|uniref:CRP-like protein Clp n=1 Tax=Solilutibacter pythonis TaxID=2483112 RepID=A0A3M2I685_9GAMM|nr:helix-turn-helix domain-containing protein [Lysobacter pythonis]RMH93784.1 transcriptional regulator [Lysobacter pythonis]